MAKLFVAIDLPDDACRELARLQPAALAGVRLTEPSQMHVTLHFIGEADRDRMAAALRHARAQVFHLEFGGVGQFPSQGGAVTLWAGVKESGELRALRAAIAAALAGEGFQPESRPYTPHVTLARCEPTTPAGVVEEFLVSHASFTAPAVPVLRLGLYSSAWSGEGPVYRCEQSFALTGVSGE